MEKKKKILDLFLHDKPTGIILSLKDSTGKYASILSKETDCTYTHTLKILTQLKESGIVEFEKKGRIKFVRLTTTGADIAHELEGLVRQLERLSEEKPKKEKSKRKSRKPYKKGSSRKEKSRERITRKKKKSDFKKKKEIDLGRKKSKQAKIQRREEDEMISKGTDETSEKKEVTTRIQSPFVEINLDEAKIFLILPQQQFKVDTIDKTSQQLNYGIELNGEKQGVIANVKANNHNVAIVEEKRISLEKPLENFRIDFPDVLQMGLYKYYHHNKNLYAFVAIGNNRGKMHRLYDENGNINPLPKKDVWVLLNEDFELKSERIVDEEIWIWEKYRPFLVNLKETDELIIRNTKTEKEERLSCETTFFIEGEQLIEDDLKNQRPLLTGETLRIKAPRENPLGWNVWIQNKVAGYRVVTKNWIGVEPFTLKLPEDLPCECGEFQVDICEQGRGIPIDTLFFRYIPFIELRYPKDLIVPDIHQGHKSEIIEVILGRNTRDWELKKLKNLEVTFKEDMYQIKLPSEENTLHFSIVKRGKPETEIRLQVTIPRLKWKTSKQKRWNDKPIMIKRDELTYGEDLYLSICTNDLNTRYDLLAILEANDQRLQEARFIRKGMVYTLQLNRFYGTIKENKGKVTLKVEILHPITRDRFFDVIYCLPDIEWLKKALELLVSLGYDDIYNLTESIETDYEVVEKIIREKVDELRDVCEYISKESKSEKYEGLLKKAQEKHIQENLVDEINYYVGIVNIFRDEMNEVVKRIGDEIREIKEKDNIDIIKAEDAEKVFLTSSKRIFETSDVVNFYKLKEKIEEMIELVKYKKDEFWRAFVSDVVNPGNMCYLARKWKYFKDKWGTLENMDRDFDERYIFGYLEKDEKIRRKVSKYVLSGSLDDTNLYPRILFMNFLSRKDKEIAKRDANKFFMILLSLKKKIQDDKMGGNNYDNRSS